MIPKHPPDMPRLLSVARGDEPADLLLTGGRLVNVFTGEVLPAAVAVVGEWIAGVGDYTDAATVIELGGAFVAPGLIDAHVHVESSLLTPREFARAVVPRGVTTVISDPHEIANVLGADGIHFMLTDAADAPLSMLVAASSCVPATAMATSGATLTAADLRRIADWDGVIGLAELMNFPGVIGADPEVLAKIDAYRGRPIDGHSPGLSGRALSAYVAAGPRTDHEATTPEEALEKLRLGMVIFLREATNAHNLRTLLACLTEANSRRLCLCTDDRQPSDLLAEGSIDHLVRVAIECGVEPVTALSMATLNAAETFGLHDRGAVGPGRLADLVVFAALDCPRPNLVIRHGRVVAREGELIADVPAGSVRQLGAIHVDLATVNLEVAAAAERMRVIGVVPDQLITEHRLLPVRSEDGLAVADPTRDIAKMAVIERHRRTGRVGVGFVQGIGLREGAIAGTVAHDHHNLVVIGCDDASMRRAARAVVEAGGGLAAARGDDVLALLALPIAGLMSAGSAREVAADLESLLRAARSLGSGLHDPFMAMSFLALEVIPHLKLTDQGLVDVDRFERVSLFVDS